MWRKRDGCRVAIRGSTSSQTTPTSRVGARNPKKSNGLFCERVAVKYAWIDSHRDAYCVTVMCKVLNVNKSSFYDSLRATPSPRTQLSFAIRAAVRLAHEESHGIYGSQKIAEVMKQDDRMETACRNTVARAMKEMGLKSCISKKFKPTSTGR